MKTYASYLIAFLLSIGIGFADTGSALQEQFESIKKMNYLNQVGVYFVNEITKATPKEYNLKIDQEESKELTLLLKNDSDKDLSFRIKFADQTLTNDGTRGCGAAYDQGQGPRRGFSAFISAPRTGDILIPAQSEMTKKIGIRFPIGVDPIQKGCIAYGVREDIKENKDSLISIVTRKVLYLDVLIGGTEQIQHQIQIGKVSGETDEQGELTIGITIENLGNVNSSIQIQGTISNILGFQKSFSASQMALNGQESTIRAKIGKIPAYKGFFTIQATITDTPDFGIEGGEKKIKTLYFQPHWRMLIPLLLVITILYRILRKPKGVPI